MPLPRRARTPGEEVLFDVRPHLSYLAGPAFATVAAVAAALFVVAFFGQAPAAIGWVLVAVVVAPTLWLLARAGRWMLTSLVVTSDRVVVRRGPGRSRQAELRLRHLSGVEVRRSLLQRVLGTGSLVLTWPGGCWVLDHVSSPEEVAAMIAGGRRPRDVLHADTVPGTPRSAAHLEDPTPVPRASGSTGTGQPVVAGAPTLPGRFKAPQPPGVGSARPVTSSIQPGALWRPRQPPRVAAASSEPEATEAVTARRTGPSETVGRPEGPGTDLAPTELTLAVPRQILELAELARLGILTDGEFQAKKRELLGRM